MESSLREIVRDYAQLTVRGSEVFWSYAKRWFLVAVVVGVLVGVFVTGFERLVTLGWNWARPNLTFPLMLLAPTLGLAVSGLCLQYLTVNPDVHGTEEYIKAFHERGGVLRFRSFPGKVLASLATLISGGSAGLEGPSIYAGSAIGAFMLRRLRPLGFGAEDVRTLMVAGAAAGISAVFKAPLTGIVFALEVPYRDDLAREALVPALIASVSSYFVLVQFLGVRPLFAVSERYLLATSDLLWSIALGLVVGILARAFIASFHGFGRFARSLPVPLWVRTAGGGLVTGLFGVASALALGSPVALGPGYVGVGELLGGGWAGWSAVILLICKAGAVLATLASGAAGGIFIPMIVLGAAAGSAIDGFVPGTRGALFPVVGMSAFLAAGYNAPLAAAVFVAETTGGAGYMIPALVASAVAYAVAGKTSVSDQQRWRRESRVQQIMSVPCGTIMTRDVFTASTDETVERFVTTDVVTHRHKSLPVVDESGLLVGVVALSDAQACPREMWATTPLEAIMRKDLLVTTEDVMVGEIAAQMAARDIDRVPVVESADSATLVGIISTTDIVDLGRVVDAGAGSD